MCCLCETFDIKPKELMLISFLDPNKEQLTLHIGHCFEFNIVLEENQDKKGDYGRGEEGAIQDTASDSLDVHSYVFKEAVFRVKQHATQHHQSEAE